MDAAASIIGLIAVGTKIYGMLNNFVTTYKEAPEIAKTILEEVRDFRYALERLRPYVEQVSPITPLGAAATDVYQLSLTLASCVSTFSQVEKALDRLMPIGNEKNYIARIRWTLASADIGVLLGRIQQHKASLSLLLAIWMSESSSQTEASLDSLNDVLRELLLLNEQKKAVELVADGGDISSTNTLVSTEPEAGRESMLSTTDVETSSITSISTYSFRSRLLTSRPYRRIALFDSGNSEFSIATSQRRGGSWSTLRSIGSNHSVFSLPATLRSIITRSTQPSISSLSSQLLKSRPYQHNVISSDSGSSMLSVATSQRRVKKWSTMLSIKSNQSIFSFPFTNFNFSCISIMADGNPSRIPIPIDVSLLYKHEWYTLSPSSSRSMTEVWEDVQKESPIPDKSYASSPEISLHDMKAMTALITTGAYLDGPFLSFCARRNIGLAHIIIDRAYGPGLNDKGVDPVLIAALRAGEWGVAHDLFDKQMIPGDGSMSPNWRANALDYATKESLMKILCAQLVGSSDFKSNGVIPLAQAVNSRDSTGETALRFACRSSNVNLVKFLIANDADPGVIFQSGNSPMQQSSLWPRQRSLIKALLDGGAALESKNAEGRTLLLEFIRSQEGELSGSDLALLNLLLDTVAFLTSTDTEGNNALLSAIECGKLSIVQRLLEAGADVEARNTISGKSALHQAVRCDNPTIVKILLERKALVNTFDNSGRTPLHDACVSFCDMENHLEIITYLLHHSASVDSIDQSGNTAIHHLFRTVTEAHIHSGLVELLLERGADIHRQNVQGQSAISYLGASNHIEIMKLVESVKAKFGRE